MTMYTSWQREDSKVFHYGFLSSRTSGALKEFMDEHRLSLESKTVLNDASSLLHDILSAQQLYGADRENASPRPNAVDALSCALEVIIMHRREFHINDLPGMVALMKTLDRTLAALLANQNPSPADLQTTRSFFQKLATLMLAQLSTPQESHSLAL